MRHAFTALLATLAIGQAAATPFKHRHLHAKREAAPLDVGSAVEDVEQRDVDWSKVHYTYSSGQTWGQPTAAPAPASGPAVANAAVVAAPTAAPASSGAASPASSAASTAPTGGSSSSLTSADAARLSSMGVKGTGVNAGSNSGGNSVWLGGGGQYENEFTNDSGEAVILIVWSATGLWVNAQQPLITVSLGSGESTTVSFAEGQSGGWSAIKSDTQLVNGLVSETWGEYTFKSMGAVDVSREVNMSGRPMTIAGPTCTSDFNRCVFVCNSGNTCTTGYSLKNCAAGSQKTTQYGQYAGADSGGCSWEGDSAQFQTTFS